MAEQKVVELHHQGSQRFAQRLEQRNLVRKDAPVVSAPDRGYPRARGGGGGGTTRRGSCYEAGGTREGAMGGEVKALRV